MLSDAEADRIQRQLEHWLARMVGPDFIAQDPISVPHLFTDPIDIEIAGFLAATLAWGQRTTVLRSCHRLMAAMDHAPADFVQHASDSDLARLDGFVHRTFSSLDCQHFLRVLGVLYRERGGLRGVVCGAVQPNDLHIGAAWVALRREFVRVPGGRPQTLRHLPDVLRGSAAKRLNMWLRWLVRTPAASSGVDFGLWTDAIAPHQLICPLDVHVGRVARELGLLRRTQDDWRAALELTATLRQLCPHDPVRYDLALFGMGVAARR